MPNWCSNSMSISGPKEKIKALWEKAQSKENQPDQPSLLEAMVPIGEWEYGAAVDAWGTKWDISLEGLEYEEDGDTASISGWFDSAWSPPIEAFKTYCNLNEDVSAELSFFEPGVGFVGRWDNGNGEDYYDIDPDELDDIPEDLREEWNIDSWYEEDEEEGDDKSI